MARAAAGECVVSIWKQFPIANSLLNTSDLDKQKNAHQITNQTSLSVPISVTTNYQDLKNDATQGILNSIFSGIS